MKCSRNVQLYKLRANSWIIDQAQQFPHLRFAVQFEEERIENKSEILQSEICSLHSDKSTSFAVEKSSRNLWSLNMNISTKITSASSISFSICDCRIDFPSESVAPNLENAWNLELMNLTFRFSYQLLRLLWYPSSLHTYGFLRSLQQQFFSHINFQPQTSFHSRHTWFSDTISVQTLDFFRVFKTKSESIWAIIVHLMQVDSDEYYFARRKSNSMANTCAIYRFSLGESTNWLRQKVECALWMNPI